MENLEMIRVGENGQLYVDFDALEAITSAQFVNEVRRFWEIFDDSVVKKADIVFERNSAGKIQVVRVYMTTFAHIKLFSYYVEDDFWKVDSLFDSDLERLWNLYSSVRDEVQKRSHDEVRIEIEEGRV